MTDAVYPHELATLLDDRNFDIDVLSLDCFDTLIWRNVNAPKDVFADLGIAGVSGNQRALAERRARRRASFSHSRDEVTIEEIYRELMPDADEAAWNAGIAAELAAEGRHCYAFRPTVELMRSAKRRGLEVVIVSDTYLSATQLTDLIRMAAGDDVVELIDRIFCSSEFGTPKAGGLFEPVLRRLEVAPGRVLHIGDNLAADLQAPRYEGMRALHLVQFDETTSERLRLETVASILFDPEVGHTRPAFQPQRAVLAMAQPRLEDPVEALGYAVLGPVFYGFAHWLKAEVDAVAAATAGRTHLVFLLRDGYLPKLAFDALGTGLNTTAVHISRFTSVASSFVDEASVLDYIERALPSTPPEAVARQLLFNEREIKHIVGQLPPNVERRNAQFVKLVREPQTMRSILARSRAMAEGLVAHVKAETGAEAGDTLVLADLGYAGTVQDYIEPLLRRQLGVAVAGRYLLLRRKEVRKSDKRGLIDDRRFDIRALNALCGNVAVLEQLSTIASGSVVDYAADGTPIHAENVIGSDQGKVRSIVQSACVSFAREANEAFHTRAKSEATAWWDAATAALARLLFLPAAGELTAISQFEQDVNLGTDQLVRLFDADRAGQELRRRGLFYVNGTDRMYLPAELHGQGFPLRVTSMASRRFELNIQQSDFDDRKIVLPIIISEAGAMIDSEVEAHRTHDGYFVANIPIGVGRFAVGIKFGALFEWVQIEAAWFVKVQHLMLDTADGGAIRQDAEHYFDGIEAVAGGLYHCVEEHGFMLVPPPRWAPGQMVLSVAFRPVVERPVARDVALVSGLAAGGAAPREIVTAE